MSSPPPSTFEPSCPTRRTHLLILAAIVVLAAAVRLQGITDQSLWFDEILTWRSATVPVSEVWASVLHWENTSPGYFYLINLSAKVFGHSDLSLRMPSAILGVASVVAIYWLGRELFGVREGVLAAVLLAVSRYHHWYSQEARTYSLIVFLATVSSACFVKMLRTDARSTRWEQVLYVLASAYGLWAHPFIGFVYLAQNGLFFYRLIARRLATGIDVRRWLTLQGAVAASFAPWLPHTLKVAEVGLPWMTESTPPWVAFVCFAGSWAMLSLMTVLAGVAIIRACLGSAAEDGRDRERDMVLFALFLTLAPVIVPWALSAVTGEAIYTTRYGIPALVGMILLTARGLAVLKPMATVVGLVALLAFSGMALRPSYVERQEMVHRADIRTPALEICRRADSGDAVAFGAYALQFMYERYCPRQDLSYHELGGLPSPATDARAPRRLWLLSPDNQSAAQEEAAQRAGYGTVVRRVPSFKFVLTEMTAAVATTQPAQQPAIE